MPRIYAINEAHTEDQPEVRFINGAAAVPSGTNTSRFAAMGLTIDASRDHLEVWDRLTVAELDELLASFGITVEDDATKAEKVAAFEAKIPMDSLSITVGEATLDSSKIKITVETTTGYTYYRKFLEEGDAPDISRGAKPGTGWKKMTLSSGVQDEIAVGEDDIAVAVIGVKDGVTLALATADLPEPEAEGTT